MYRLALFALLATSSALAAGNNNATLEAHDGIVDVLDERGWTDVTFGLMLERDITPEEQHLFRRAHPETRDLLEDHQQDVKVRFDELGGMLLPASIARRAVGLAARHPIPAKIGGTPSEAHAKRNAVVKKGKKKHGKGDKKKGHHKRMAKLAKRATKLSKTSDVSALISSAFKSVGKSFAAKITWYTGRDLLGPSCVTHSKWAPTDRSMIAAVTIQWSGKPKCGSYLQLRPKNSKKAVVVRIVDSCGGCKPGSAHVDLTMSAFSALFNLDVGLVNGIQVQVIADPVKKYNKKAIDMYGPKLL